MFLIRNREIKDKIKNYEEYYQDGIGGGCHSGGCYADGIGAAGCRCEKRSCRRSQQGDHRRAERCSPDGTRRRAAQGPHEGKWLHYPYLVG